MARHEAFFVPFGAARLAGPDERPAGLIIVICLRLDDHIEVADRKPAV